MTDNKVTLAGIKKAQAKFEKAWAKYQKFGEVETMGGRNAYEDMTSARDKFATAANMLALLTVVEAFATYYDGDFDDPYEAYAKIADALKQLREGN